MKISVISNIEPVKYSMFFFLFFLFSCGSSHNPSQNKYSPAIHLQKGDKFYYETSSETHTSAKIDGKVLEPVKKMEVGLIYEVINDAMDSIQLKIVYDKLHLIMKNDKEEQDITAKKSGETSDPAEMFFGGLLGNGVTVIMDKKGDVLRVDGYHELAGRTLDSLRLTDANLRENIRQQMNKMIGEDFLKQTLQAAFHIMPDSAIGIDDSWTKQGAQTDEVKAGMNTKFTVRSLDKNLARLDARSTFSEGHKEDSIDIMGYKVQAALEGEQKGHFDIDISTGMLMGAKSDLSLEGNLQVMGREVPVKITSERTIEAKKIH